MKEENINKLNKSLQRLVAHSEKKNTKVSSQHPSIFKVPETLRKMKENAYSPRVVSIGPLHRKSSDHLKETEQHKVNYMCSLLLRTMQPTNTPLQDDRGGCKSTNTQLQDEYVKGELLKCGEAMLDVVDSVRACYAESSKLRINNVKLAQFMLVDGCFILEFLYRCHERPNAENDPFLANSLVFHDVRHDLLLLENQIPFLVLQKLFQLTIGNIPHETSANQCEVSVDVRKQVSVIQLVLELYDDIINPEIREEGDNTVAHILGLLHKFYLPCKLEGICEPIIQYSATELDRARINVKAGGENLDVKFTVNCLFSWVISTKEFITKCATAGPTITRTSNDVATHAAIPPKCCWLSFLCHYLGGRTFKIPPLCIDGITEPFLRNLIAFEQCSDDIRRHVTSYAFLMDTLINSDKDVELLVKANVLQNYVGSSQDVSDLINNICKEVVLGDFFFYNQWKEVDNYCKRFWPKHLASLKRTYFNSPWNWISLIAASVLLALTSVQTYYSTQ